jgi:hypothetical protein
VGKDDFLLQRNQEFIATLRMTSGAHELIRIRVRCRWWVGVR